MKATYTGFDILWHYSVDMIICDYTQDKITRNIREHKFSQELTTNIAKIYLARKQIYSYGIAVALDIKNEPQQSTVAIICSISSYFWIENIAIYPMLYSQASL